MKLHSQTFLSNALTIWN